MTYMQNKAIFITQHEKGKHATNSLHTSVSENALQGKTHQVQNSHDDKQLATTTLNMPYVQLRS